MATCQIVFLKLVMIKAEQLVSLFGAYLAIDAQISNAGNERDAYVKTMRQQLRRAVGDRMLLPLNGETRKVLLTAMRSQDPDPWRRAEWDSWITAVLSERAQLVQNMRAWFAYDAAFSAAPSTDDHLVALATELARLLAPANLSVEDVHRLDEKTLDTVLCRVFGVPDQVPRVLDHPRIPWAIRRRAVYEGESIVELAMKNSIKDGRLAFVNREDAVEAFVRGVRASAMSRVRDDGSALTISVAEQCKGAGKTRLGAYLFARLTQEVAQSSRGIKRQSHDYVFVRLAKRHRIVDLTSIITHAIISNYFAGDNHLMELYIGETGLLNLLADLSRGVFLHLDEISNILTCCDDYRALQFYIESLCRNHHSIPDFKPVCPYLSGVFTAQKSLGELSAPFNYQSLCLDTIGTSKWKEMLVGTLYYDGKTTLDKILPDDGEFPKLLWEKTCGNPRSIALTVQYVLSKYQAWQNNPSSSPFSFVSALLNFHLPYQVSLDFDDSNIRKAIAKIFEVANLILNGDDDVTINFDKKILASGKPHREMTYGHIASMLNLHWSGGRGAAKVWIGEDLRKLFTQKLQNSPKKWSELGSRETWF